MKQPTTHNAHINIPSDLWAKLKRVARQNHRTAKAEVVLALENRVREQLSLGNK
jgi:hypothetical protein